MRRAVLVLAAVLAPGLTAWGQTLTVAAAANLAPVELPLGEAFTREYPGLSLRFVFGASGTLVTQILNGAPYQAFLSADLGFAQKLVDAGLAPGPVRTYAVGKLIFLALRPVDLSRGVKVLLDPGVVRFADANPETAPYGRAAVQALTRAGIYGQVRAKEIRGQNITQALQFVLTATDFGFVNKSALGSKELEAFREEGRFWFEVPQDLYDPVEQGFVVLETGAGTPEGKAFARFLLSPAAQAVFLAAGYGKP